MEETPDDQRFRLVELLLKCSIVIKKISDVLAILIDKRATLEEKMIKSYFSKLASAQIRIIEKILTALEATENPISEATIADLRRIADDIVLLVDGFLKAARYDLNYLEQYFEHRFYGDLQSSQLLEDSLKVFASLGDRLGSDQYEVGTQAETE
jgi:hypothetical protein